jgi:hypothetical protein
MRAALRGDEIDRSAALDLREPQPTLGAGVDESSGDSLLNSVSKASEEISELSPELESW